jgi:hypothetical protein
MYFPRAPKEPSGCFQSLLITRAIFAILAVPLLLIGGALMATLFTLYLFTLDPPLALIPLSIGVLGIYGLARWEKARIEKETPPPEE